MKKHRNPLFDANANYEPLGKCPCGQMIAVSTHPPAVMHAMPYCQKFLEFELDEFLTYVRRSRGLPEPT